jgi:hypothetical protein
MIRRVIAAVALTLSLTATAHAATLFGGPMVPQMGEEQLQCAITNVTNINQNVTMEIYDHNGDLLDSLGPFALAPLESVHTADYAAFPNFPRFCKFTVPKNNNVRAVACVLDLNFNQRNCVPAQ